jgi:hypothetical protein
MYVSNGTDQELGIATDTVFDRLAHGDVPSRLVFDFATN